LYSRAESDAGISKGRSVKVKIFKAHQQDVSREELSGMVWSMPMSAALVNSEGVYLAV
jgi:hypothetical protein